MGLHFGILGLRLGTLGIHFGVFLRLWGGTLDPFCDFSGKGSTKVQKRIETGSWNGCIFDGISSFPRKWETAFRLRRRERIEVQATHVLAVCLHFRPSFFASFFNGFWDPLGAQIHGVLVCRRQRRAPLITV